MSTKKPGDQEINLPDDQETRRPGNRVDWLIYLPSISIDVSNCDNFTEQQKKRTCVHETQVI